ncbi:MAG: PAS domain-containing protein [Methylobacterium ajmalii]
MHADDLKVRSDAFLKAIEDTGLVGTWHWSFASGEQRWSPGFVRLLGLPVHSVAPSYALFVDLVCPADRRRIASPADVLAGHVLPCALLRVIRPSGELRNLSVRSELRFAPDGRPTGLSGIALDVTDRARLSLMLQREQLRRRALYQATHAITYTVEPNLPTISRPRWRRPTDWTSPPSGATRS